MCGICGAVCVGQAHPIDVDDLIAMRDSLAHRGPDDAGHYLAPGVALGSRRLAILDLSQAGHMPMSTPDGRYRITYNGEVYNYQALRSLLEARGHRFRSHTDTEVLLHLYADEGPGMLNRLNGMFSIAIWDELQRTLFLARDRVGIKPLYYWHEAGKLYFASEPKALFAAGVSREFDRNTWEELVCFRYVAGERTPFTGVKRLLPGHYLIWKNGHPQRYRWWNLSERARTLRKDIRIDVRKWFETTFDSAVQTRRISDVRVGVLLSGGLDSSSVAASLAAATVEQVSSFTVRFAEAEYDEGLIARQVANKWHLRSHELVVTPDEILSRLRHASWMNDEPLAHACALHLFAISQYAKRDVTVLLSGEGSDETLGGYVRYQPLRYPTLLNLLRPIMPWFASQLVRSRRLRKLNQFLALGSINRFLLFNTCDVLPADLASLGVNCKTQFSFREHVLDEARYLYPGDPARQAMYSDQHVFLSSILEQNDRMTMAASIECRVPFLDYRLVEGLAALPSSLLFAGRRGKSLLRQSVGHRLPEAATKHRKWGFGVPWTSYLRQIPELREFVSSLPNHDTVRESPLHPQKVKQLVKRFLEGEDQYCQLITQLVMIAIWHNACFGRSSMERRNLANSNSALAIERTANSCPL